jgi:hypothetical protein
MLCQLTCKEEVKMKPQVKNDSWVYTASKTSARVKVKRLTHKRRRRNGRAAAAKEGLL